jgi:hypothetical protein
MARYRLAAFAFAAAIITGIYLSHPAFPEDRTPTPPAAERGSGQLPSPPSACDTYAASEFDPNRKAEGVPFEKVDPHFAIPACEAAVHQFPDDDRLHFQLGRAYDKAGNFAAVSNTEKLLNEALRTHRLPSLECTWTARAFLKTPGQLLLGTEKLRSEDCRSHRRPSLRCIRTARAFLKTSG